MKAQNNRLIATQAVRDEYQFSLNDYYPGITFAFGCK